MATRKSAKPKAGPKRRSGAQNSAKRKKAQRGTGRPFQPGNPWRIPPGETLNPGGRPKLLKHAFLEWLEAENDQGLTNAAGVAMALGRKALQGQVAAAREIRRATEGDTFKFDLAQLTDEQLERLANGEDPGAVVGAASQSGAGAAPAEGDGPAQDGAGR